MTIGLFGHTKLTDLAMSSIRRNDPYSGSFMVYVTQSYAKSEYEILNSKNLKDHGVLSFFVGSIGYKSMCLKANIYEYLVNHSKEEQTPLWGVLEVIDHAANIPTHKEWQRGAGNWIMEGTIIQPFTTIGNGNTIWSGSIVSHHSKLDNFNWISPGVTLCGEVIMGSNNFVGSGAVICNGTSIGSRNIIQAGAIVSHNMTSGQVAMPGVNRITSIVSIEDEWKKLR